MAAPALKVILLALLSCFIHCNAYPLPLDLSASLSLFPTAEENHWVETWTASPEAVKLGQGPVTFLDTTIRQTIPLSIGGGDIRLTLSNAYGMTDLFIDKVTIALPLPENGRSLGSGSIDISTLHTLTFNGASLAYIPQGAQGVSDPVTFNPPLPSGQVLTITMYLSAGQASTTTTTHVYSRTSVGTAQGDQTSAISIPTSGSNGLSWYFINTVEAWSPPSTKALVALGNSITDGRTSPVNADIKWPSILSTRVHATPGLQGISIVNEGSGANNVLGPSGGPTVHQDGAVARLNRDVLSLSGVRYVVVLEGINDIGNSYPDDAGQADIQMRLIQAYQQIISEVHASGLLAIGATLTPFLCPPGHKGTSNRYALYPIREQSRQAINDWIRNSGSYDYVVDFDQILRDPRNPSYTANKYIGRDCLHPNGKGTTAMANGFPLELFSVLGV